MPFTGVWVWHINGGHGIILCQRGLCLWVPQATLWAEKQTQATRPKSFWTPVCRYVPLPVHCCRFSLRVLLRLPCIQKQDVLGGFPNKAHCAARIPMQASTGDGQVCLWYVPNAACSTCRMCFSEQIRAGDLFFKATASRPCLVRPCRGSQEHISDRVKDQRTRPESSSSSDPNPLGPSAHRRVGVEGSSPQTVQTGSTGC